MEPARNQEKHDFFGHFGFGRAPKSECPLLGHWNEGITNRMPKTSEKLDTQKPNCVTSSGMFCFFYNIFRKNEFGFV